MPYVSVIVPAYNVEGTLDRSVRSALGQTHQNIEVIVVDDASTDGTHEQVHRIKDKRLKLIRFEENKGPSAARNAAIDLAKGDWIALLDADDWWHPERLSRLLDVANKSGATMVADDQQLYSENASCIYDTRFSQAGLNLMSVREIELPEYFELSLGIIQPIINMHFVNQWELRFDENHRYGEDFLLITECLFNGARLFLTPEALYTCAVREGSLSASRSRIMVGMRQIWTELSERDEVRSEALQKVVARKIKQADDRIAYSTVVDAIKRGDFRNALNALFATPRFPLLAVRRIPRSLRYRIRTRRVVGCHRHPFNPTHGP